MKNRIFNKAKKIFFKKKKINRERTELQKLQDKVEFYKNNGYWN